MWGILATSGPEIIPISSCSILHFFVCLDVPSLMRRTARGKSDDGCVLFCEALIGISGITAHDDPGEMPLASLDKRGNHAA